MAESARDALRSASTPKRYAALAALVLEALRPGIPLYEAGAKDPDDQINEASAADGDRLEVNTMRAGLPGASPAFGPLKSATRRAIAGAGSTKVTGQGASRRNRSRRGCIV